MTSPGSLGSYDHAAVILVVPQRRRWIRRRFQAGTRYSSLLDSAMLGSGHLTQPLTRRPARPDISELLLDARGPVAESSAMALSG
jgi:hypothetical protein